MPGVYHVKIHATLRRDGAGRFLPRVFAIGDPRFMDLPGRPVVLPLDDRGARWTTLDRCDAVELGRWKWHAAQDRLGKCYARRLSAVYLHREVMARVAPSPGEEFGLVDHINGDRLDNRRENLRWASYSENARNVSGYYYRQQRFL